MKQKIIILLGLLILGGSDLNAAYYMIPGNTARVDETSNNCYLDSDGPIRSSGSTCTVYLPVPGFAGSTLNSITVYYYDNSGSQYMYAYVKRKTMGSSSSSTSLGSFSDTSTSASIQSSTISPASYITTSYAYYVQVTLNYGTELRGIKINY